MERKRAHVVPRSLAAVLSSLQRARSDAVGGGPVITAHSEHNRRIVDSGQVPAFVALMLQPALVSDFLRPRRDMASPAHP
ncbi:hypothetical protein VTO73DRAFT_2748 [Trametes versicolor]